MRFAYLSGDMTDVRILFGDIVAKELGKESLFVIKEGKLFSPFEYAYFERVWQVSTKWPLCL